jgi:GT2 family glycosyltransferase
MPSASAGSPRTAFVILEYCGGARTDALHRQLSAWNPRDRILVLDNASPADHASSVTHRNPVNTYVGGGIRDCVALAEAQGASYVFYCTNDVEILDPLVIADFERVAESDPSVAVVSCSLSADTGQARLFPWMIRRPDSGLRRVRFADPICCLIRLEFLRSFGGFPPSHGGWGYSSEMAYHARRRDLKIYVQDRCAIRHPKGSGTITTTEGVLVSKAQEASRVYAQRYGSVAVIRSSLQPPAFDEDAVVSA